MLGNLSGFDPDADLLPVGELEELDRFTLNAFNDLCKTVREGYESYEFHSVYRAIYNFCVIDLSNLYLDVIKDRLYCGDEQTRRAAQSALYLILDGMTRLIAPILAFTSDEIWAAMPHSKKDNAESVVLNDMPGFDPALALSEDEKARWEKLIFVRDTVNKALEVARSEGVFKKAQDTEVNISVGAEDKALLESVDLAALCIVSKVTVTEGSVQADAGSLVPCAITVTLSQAPKCPRCWNHDAHIGQNGHHAELCDRCAAVLGE
jgi:isoleucyl-tRNA synthetase